MPKQTLAVLPQKFSIYSMDVRSEIPKQVFNASVYFIGKTNEELSLVVPESISIDAEECDSGWCALEVLGPLQLSMIGIMADIGNILAEAKVSIFVISTFETDFFLVKEEDLTTAAQSLESGGYKVIL